MNKLNLGFDTFRVMLLGLVLAVSAGKVSASLGQARAALAATSADAAPGARSLAATPTAAASRYTRHGTELESGTTVYEYARPDGLVFAVTWRGPVLPDLSALLGGYFNTFKRETERARLVGRRGAPVSMDRDGLVVSSNGRMRNFFGLAYAPALIPAGVNIKDVLQ